MKDFGHILCEFQTVRKLPLGNCALLGFRSMLTGTFIIKTRYKLVAIKKILIQADSSPMRLNKIQSLQISYQAQKCVRFLENFA